LLHDLQEESAKHGLVIHPDKTKVLTNERTNPRDSILVQGHSIEVQGHSIEVLSGEASIKHLGKHFAMTGMQEIDFDKRVAAAWGSFALRRDELTNKHYPLKSKLKLFDLSSPMGQQGPHSLQQVFWLTEIGF